MALEQAAGQPGDRVGDQAVVSAMLYALEVDVDGIWGAAEVDGRTAVFASKEDAEIEARWSLDEGTAWRVVPFLSEKQA